MRAEGPSRLVAIALVAAVASMVAFVVWVLVSPIDLPFQHVDASIQMTPRVDGHTVHVTGTANLPDGSLIDLVSVAGDAEIETAGGTGCGQPRRLRIRRRRVGL